VAGAIFEPTNALSKIYTDPLLLEFASGIILGVIYLDGGSFAATTCARDDRHRLFMPDV
jgi:hypothetical protein